MSFEALKTIFEALELSFEADLDRSQRVRSRVTADERLDPLPACQDFLGCRSPMVV